MRDPTNQERTILRRALQNGLSHSVPRLDEEDGFAEAGECKTREQKKSLSGRPLSTQSLTSVTIASTYMCPFDATAYPGDARPLMDFCHNGLLRRRLTVAPGRQSERDQLYYRRRPSKGYSGIRRAESIHFFEWTA